MIPRWRIGALFVAALLVLSVDVYLLSRRNETTTVDLSTALEEFRATEGTPGDTDGAVSPPEVAAPVIPDPAVTPAPAPETTAAPADTVPAPVETTPQTAPPPVEAPPPPPPTAPQPPPAYRLPEEGVYMYSAQGGESISLLGARHTYGPQAFATVRHLGGCEWEHRLTVVREHIDIRRLCSQEGAYLQAGQARQITFLGTTEGSLMDCQPAQVHHAVGEAPGATGTGPCSGSGGYNGVLTRTYRGTEPITIGGTVVDAVRVDIDSQLTGTSVGESHDRLWLHPETGLTLRWDRTVNTVASVFGAQVHYSEEASFVLVSLVPQR